MGVYFIRVGDDGPVKIGFSIDVARRKAHLQVSHSVPLKLLRTIEGGRATERWLHAHFAPRRLQGEWFEFDDAMMSVEAPALPDVTIGENTVASRLRSIRLQLALTQKDLGEMLVRSQSTIDGWEHGLAYPSLEIIATLADLAGVDAGWIAFGEAA